MLEKITISERFLQKINHKYFYLLTTILFLLSFLTSLAKSQNYLAGASLIMFMFCFILYKKENLEKAINNELFDDLEEEEVKEVKTEDNKTEDKEEGEKNVKKLKKNEISFD